MPYPYTVHVNQLNKKGDRAPFKAGKPFWVAFSILLVLLIITGSLLSLRLYDYSQVDKRELSLKCNMAEDLEVFSIIYRNDSGEITVEGTDGQKVIAPGTDVEYTVRLRNTDTVAIDYSLIPRLKFLSPIVIPIEVRILDNEDKYIVGDAKTWATLEELNLLEEEGTLEKGKTAEYIFQWRWPFESGDDQYDTWLGNSVLDTEIGVNISFAVHAEANVNLEDNGGIKDSGLGDVILAIIFAVLLLSAITLLIVTAIRKRMRKKKDQAMIVKQPAKKVEPPKSRQSDIEKLLGSVSRIDIHISKDKRK